ncbi:MAG: 50S ribosomal protein L23 [bacterium]
MTNISIKKHTSEVIKKPRVTEKGVIGGEKGIYIFEVHKSANKTSIAKAIKEMYKVTPTAVNIVNRKAKNVVVRGRAGKKAAIKKAYVFLKKGDKIDIA